MEVNRKLRDKFEGFFVDVQTVTSEKGVPQKKFYYKDGLHLSQAGCQKLAKLIEGIFTQNAVAIITTGDVWTAKFDSHSMCISLNIKDVEINALIDTGSSVSIISKDVFDRFGEVSLETASLNLTELTGANIKVLGLLNTFVNLGENGFQARVYVVEGMKYEMILGRDIMTKRVHCIEYAAGLISFKTGLY